MNRRAYEDKILRVAERIRERRENEATARAYVAAKQRIAAGKGSWGDQYAVDSLETWANSPTIMLDFFTRKRGR